MASVYISYRKDDTNAVVGRLSDRLQYELGTENVFLDIDSIEPGADFVEAIESTIANATVVLVVIGSRWLTASDMDGEPRLSHPDDFIRLEIRMALARSAWVIPVLVDGASMPRRVDLPPDIAALGRRNALQVRSEGFASDVARLVDAIRRIDELGAGRGASTVPRARLTAVGEELRAIAVEFFSTAGRTVVDTLDRRLLGPEPILIVDSPSLSEQDVTDVAATADGRRLYVVHPDRLDDDSVHTQGAPASRSARPADRLARPCHSGEREHRPRCRQRACRA